MNCYRCGCEHEGARPGGARCMEIQITVLRDRLAATEEHLAMSEREAGLLHEALRAVLASEELTIGLTNPARHRIDVPGAVMDTARALLEMDRG